MALSEFEFMRLEKLPLWPNSRLDELLPLRPEA